MEKPILFSGPMVRVLLNTKPNTWPPEPIDQTKPFKSQTRRVIKPQPTEAGLEYIETSEGFAAWQDPLLLLDEHSEDGGPCQRICPYGRPGDILWVRETWMEYKGQYFYKADGKHEELDSLIGTSFFKWRPSIFMPKEACRLRLLVKEVRVERLQDITVEDVIAEGLPADNEIRNPDHETHESIKNWFLAYAQFLYKNLWDGLNTKRGYGWDTNPWVWVVEFMRQE